MKRISFLTSLLIITLLVVPHAQAIDVRLKLSGGRNFFSLQNINRFMEDWVLWEKKDAEARSDRSFVGGDVSPLHSGFVFSGEILVSITSRLTVGIGAGFTYMELDEDKTALTIEREAGTYLYVKPIKISALPFTISGYYYFPLSSNSRLYVTGGAGPIWGKYIDRRGQRLTTKDKYSYQAFQRTSGSGTIVLGGCGFEYEFEPGLRVFLEGSARMCQISDFQGENKQEETGVLYYFEENIQEFEIWQAKYQILPSIPSEDNYRSAQKAAVDLSGFKIIVGLILKF